MRGREGKGVKGGERKGESGRMSKKGRERVREGKEGYGREEKGEGGEREREGRVREGNG